MKIIGQEEAKFTNREFKNFIKFNQQLHDIDSVILGFSNEPPPITTGIPVQDIVYTVQDNDYSTGCFMSPVVTLSKAGIELETKDSAMDKIYPLMASDNYLYIYSGFEIDQIIHYYPGSLTSDRTYSPLTRE